MTYQIDDVAQDLSDLGQARRELGRKSMTERPLEFLQDIEGEVKPGRCGCKLVPNRPIYTVVLCQLHAAAPALLAALEVAEWQGSATPYKVCPTCRGYREWGHLKGCEIGDAIKQAKGEA